MRNWFGRSLANKVAAIERQLNEIVKPFQEWRQMHRDADALQKQIQDMQAECTRLAQEIARLKGEVEEIKPPVPPEPTFNLPEDDAVLFPSQRAGIQSAIRQTLDLADVYAAVTGDKAELLRQMIEAYESELKHAYAKLERDEDMDDEERSERFTHAFLRTLTTNLLQTVIVSVYHGLKEQKAAYAPLLAALNAYLSRCHVSTDCVRPGDVLSKVSAYVDAMPDVTDDEALQGTVEEVERLPYHVHYFNEDGEKDVRRVPGSIVVWAARR